MKYIKILLILILLTSCKKENRFESVFNYIKTQLDTSNLKEFSKKEEKIAVSNLYMSYGVSFKNYFSKKENFPKIKVFFNNKGIHDSETISHILFTSLYRNINNIPMNVDNQIESFLKLIEEKNECDKLNKARAENYLNIFSIGEEIIIKKKVSNNNAVDVLCLSDSNWVFEEANDLLIIGTIELINESEETLELKVDSLSKPYFSILLDTVKVGDIIDVNLKYNIIMKNN